VQLEAARGVRLYDTPGQPTVEVSVTDNQAAAPRRVTIRTGRRRDFGHVAPYKQPTLSRSGTTERSSRPHTARSTRSSKSIADLIEAAPAHRRSGTQSPERRWREPLHIGQEVASSGRRDPRGAKRRNCHSVHPVTGRGSAPLAVASVAHRRLYDASVGSHRRIPGRALSAPPTRAPDRV
jgi:hypothetical protein